MAEHPPPAEQRDQIYRAVYEAVMAYYGMDEADEDTPGLTTEIRKRLFAAGLINPRVRIAAAMSEHPNRDTIAKIIRNAPIRSDRLLPDANDIADELLAAGLIVPPPSDAKNENPRDVAAFLFGLLKSTSGDIRDLALLAELNAYLDRGEG